MTSVSKKTNYLLFSLALLFLFFFWAGKIPLWSSDEGRFAEIAREMAETKDFVVPQFNYVGHFEKPVFSFLLTSLSYFAFGVHSVTARLTSILSAIAGIFLTFFFTQKFFNRRTAEMASLILTTSVGYVLMGRVAMIDMLMTFLLSISLYCLMTACLKQKRGFYLLSYVFMGLAFVTKGAMGIVLPTFIFLSFLIWTKNLRELTRIHLGWGIVIIGVIFIPWGIAISMREPEFSYVFLWKHQIVRFATTHFGRKRPIWFFIPILLSLSFPWSFFLPQAVKKGLTEAPETKQYTQFLICWISVILVFFSLPKSKLPYYILPVSMPLAVLVGHLFYIWEDSETRLGIRPRGLRWPLGLFSLVYFNGILGLNAFLLFWTRDPRALAVTPIVQVFSGVGLLAGITMHVLSVKKPVRFFFYSLAGMVYSFLVTVVVCMFFLAPFLSTYDFAAALKPLLGKEDTVAMYSSPDHFSDFPFHTGRRIVVVGSDRGTLTDESNEPDNAEDSRIWFQETRKFIEEFHKSPRRIYCLMEERKLLELQQDGLMSYQVIKRGAGKILIANR